MINYIDLFAGAGGLSEGFSAIGCHPISHVEMNREACDTLRTRSCYYYLCQHDNLSLYSDYLLGKISRDALYSAVPRDVINDVINHTMSVESMSSLYVKIDSLMKAQNINSVDLIVGGPPCQAYSLVGRAVKIDSMKNDPRNYLYKIYIKMLEKYSPKMFVFENVPGLLTANKGEYFADMKSAFNNAGYEIGYRVLNAKNFGVLQSRLRVIIIGWKKGSGKRYPEFSENAFTYTVSDILRDLPSLQAGESNNSYCPGKYSTYLSDTGIRKQTDILTWHCSRPNIDRDREIYRRVIDTWDKNKIRVKYTDLPDELCTHKNRSAFLDRFKVVAADLPTSHTMMAHISKDGHYFIHPDIKQARSITVREAARILTNEKYKGDALLQKKYTVDFLSKKQKTNEGEIPQYYVEGSHVPHWFSVGNAVESTRQRRGTQPANTEPLCTAAITSTEKRNAHISVDPRVYADKYESPASRYTAAKEQLDAATEENSKRNIRKGQIEDFLKTIKRTTDRSPNLMTPYGVPLSKRSPLTPKKTSSLSSREAPKSSGRYKKDIRRMSQKLHLRILFYTFTRKVRTITRKV